MKTEQFMNGEFAMDQQQVTVVAQLDFAYGKVGRRYPITSDEERTEFSRDLAERTKQITDPNTADCGDERLTIGFANGVTDRAAIDERVVAKLFGGLGLATTKALVAANALVIRDKKNIWEAYLAVSHLLDTQLGMQDAGHAGCGASANVESSVDHTIAQSSLLPASGLLMSKDATLNERMVGDMTMHKKQLLESGFYGGWNPSNHQDYLIARFPANFSYLQVDPSDLETHGHKGSGLYVVNHQDEAFVKNGRAFSVNTPMMWRLAQAFGQSTEERARIMLGFVDDTLHVGSGIVTEGFPVFAQAA